MKISPAALALLAGATFAPSLRADVPAPPTPTAAAAAPVTLRYKFTPGQVLRYKMTMDMTYTIVSPTPGGDTPKAMQMHSESVTSQTVKSVRPSDGAATIASQVESMTMTSNGQTHQYTPAELAKVNQGSVTVMTPTGQVDSTKISAFSSGAAIPGLDMSKGFITSTNALPVGPVKVGDTWDGTGTSGMLGMQMKLSSVLNQLETAPTGMVADIGQKFAGMFKLGIGGAQMPMQMTGLMTGTGKMRFDTDAGAVAGSDNAMQADMTVALPPAMLQSAPAGTPKTLRMKMTMAMKMDRLPSPTTPAPAP